MVDLNANEIQDYWDTPGAELARKIIGDELEKRGLGASMRAACIKIAPKIPMNPKYLYQIAEGYRKAGDKMIARMQAYHDKTQARPAYKKRLVVSYDDDELDQWEHHQLLTNEQRKNAFENYCVLRDIYPPEKE